MILCNLNYVVMRKLSLLLVLFSVLGYAQNFKIERAMTSGINVKLKGSVKITDSVISFDYLKADDVSYNVIKSEGASIYKTDLSKDKSEMDVRFTLKESSLYKKATHQLTVDAVDKFTNQVVQVIYFLKEED